MSKLWTSRTRSEKGRNRRGRRQSSTPTRAVLAVARTCEGLRKPPRLVRKFVTSGTIEEKIELMLTEKRQLADELIDGDGEVGLTELPDDELLDLVRLDVTRAAP